MYTSIYIYDMLIAISSVLQLRRCQYSYFCTSKKEAK